MKRLFAAAFSLLLITPAFSITVFKATEHDGTVSYSDAHIPGTNHETVMQIPEYDEPETTNTPQHVIEDDSANDLIAKKKNHYIKAKPTHIVKQHPTKQSVTSIKVAQITTELRRAQKNLLKARSFYDKVTKHQRHNHSVNAQDRDYRKKLVELLQQRIHRLETDVANLKHKRKTVHLGTEQPAKRHLSLSPSEVEKLHRMFTPEKKQLNQNS